MELDDRRLRCPVLTPDEVRRPAQRHSGHVRKRDGKPPGKTNSLTGRIEAPDTTLGRQARAPTRDIQVIAEMKGAGMGQPQRQVADDGYGPATRIYLLDGGDGSAGRSLSTEYEDFASNARSGGIADRYAKVRHNAEVDPVCRLQHVAGEADTVVSSEDVGLPTHGYGGEVGSRLGQASHNATKAPARRLYHRQATGRSAPEDQAPAVPPDAASVVNGNRKRPERHLTP